MDKGGRKYRLLMYEYMLNRWWPVTLLVAFFIFLNVGVLWSAEWYYKNPADNPLPILSRPGGMVMLSAGIISLLFSVFLLVTRKMAYVQLFDDHLRMVTPFLRLNVSNKRIQRTVTSQIYMIFPPKSLSSWKQDLIEPLLGSTVVVLHLTSYPLPRATLRMFLSPFFFYDNTPHFVLFVDDWMRFNAEIESRRTQGRPQRRPPLSSPYSASGLLDDLKRK